MIELLTIHVNAHLRHLTTGVPHQSTLAVAGNVEECSHHQSTPDGTITSSY